MLRRVLVAGCGDVGTRLGCLLAAAGHTVFGLRRRATALPPQISPVALDLRTPGPWRLPAAIDTLVFAVAPDTRNEEAYRQIYLDAPLRLLAALDEVPARVVYVSSTAVHGQQHGEWVDEGSETRPREFNGRVLLEAERALRSEHGACVILRLAGLYGPGRERMLRRALAGEAGAARWSNHIHVDDAAAALAHLIDLELPGPLYLGADALPVREDEMFAWLRARAGLPALTPVSGPVSGRRIDSRLLRDSGFELRFPDYRAGHAAAGGMRYGAGLV